MYVCTYMFRLYRHVFRTSQGSSVWLALTSREQLMSQECSKHQVLSFAKILLANEKIFCSHQCSPCPQIHYLRKWFCDFVKSEGGGGWE